MITINGHKFVRTDTDFTNTLFETGGTAYGYYKKLKNRVIFMDMQKKPFAALVKNNNGNFLVNYAVIDGKPFYQYGLSTDREKLFGIPDSYIAEIEYINQLSETYL